MFARWISGKVIQQYSNNKQCFLTFKFCLVCLWKLQKPYLIFPRSKSFRSTLVVTSRVFSHVLPPLSIHNHVGSRQGAVTPKSSVLRRRWRVHIGGKVWGHGCPGTHSRKAERAGSLGAICLTVQVSKMNEASHSLHLDLAWVVGHCLQSENKWPRNRTVLLKVKERESPLTSVWTDFYSSQHVKTD